MCARAELSLVVAWSARGQSVCVSVEEFTGLRSPHAHVIPHGALLFDWVCAKCIAGFREKGWERFATLWGIRGEFGTTYISKPVFFKNLGLFSTGSSPVRVLLYRYFPFI